MSVRFTKHILERLKARSISKDGILETLNNPKSVKRDSFGNSIAHKMIDKYLLRVFYYMDDEMSLQHIRRQKLISIFKAKFNSIVSTPFSP